MRPMLQRIAAALVVVQCLHPQSAAQPYQEAASIARAAGTMTWNEKFGPYPMASAESAMQLREHPMNSAATFQLPAAKGSPHTPDYDSMSWSHGWGLHVNPSGLGSGHPPSYQAPLHRFSHSPSLHLSFPVDEVRQKPSVSADSALHHIPHGEHHILHAEQSVSDQSPDAKSWIVPVLSRVMMDGDDAQSAAIAADHADQPQPSNRVSSAASVVSRIMADPHAMEHSSLDDEAPEDDAAPAESAPPPPPPPPPPPAAPAASAAAAEDDGEIGYKSIPLHHWALLVAVLAVILTCIISISLIVRHLTNYERPEVQKYVVRILFMAPIYSIVALLCLTFRNISPYITIIRDGYEAFTIYNFVKMLYELLGGERAVIDAMAKKKQIQMLFPLSWSEPWAMGDEMFYNCKFGVLQYVIVIPVCAGVLFVSGAAGVSRSQEWYTIDFWIGAVQLISATWAIYCLITFYLAMQEELEGSVKNALGKFLVVKAVIFFCFWQGVVLELVLLIGYVPDYEAYTRAEFVDAVEKWLICLEMVVISICFHMAYPIEEFVGPENAPPAAAAGGAGAAAGGKAGEYGTFSAAPAPPANPTSGTV